MLSVHTTPEEFKNATITGLLGFVSEVNSVEETPIIVTPFPECSVFKMFSVPHESEKPAFSNSWGLKSIFEKLRSRDGLV